MIPLMRNVQNKQIHRNKKSTAGNQGEGKGEEGQGWGRTDTGCVVSSGDDESILELESGDRCITG